MGKRGGGNSPGVGGWKGEGWREEEEEGVSGESSPPRLS